MINPSTSAKSGFLLGLVRLIDRLPTWLETTLGGRRGHALVWLLGLALILALP